VIARVQKELNPFPVDMGGRGIGKIKCADQPWAVLAYRRNGIEHAQRPGLHTAHHVVPVWAGHGALQLYDRIPADRTAVHALATLRWHGPVRSDIPTQAIDMLRYDDRPTLGHPLHTEAHRCTRVLGNVHHGCVKGFVRVFALVTLTDLVEFEAQPVSNHLHPWPPTRT